MIEKAQGKEERQGRGRHFDSRQQLMLFEVIGGSASLLKPIPATTTVQQFTVSYKNGVRVMLQST